ESQAGALGMSALLSARGLGAIFGAFLGGNFAGTNLTRLRRTILAGFAMMAVGYLTLGVAGSLAMAGLVLIVAHAGGSACWTAATTLLQRRTEDRFRGRVFSAEFALVMLTLSISSWSAGQLSDAGVDVRILAQATGALLIVPVLAWAAVGRAW